MQIADNEDSCILTEWLFPIFNRFSGHLSNSFQMDPNELCRRHVMHYESTTTPSRHPAHGSLCEFINGTDDGWSN